MIIFPFFSNYGCFFSFEAPGLAKKPLEIENEKNLSESSTGMPSLVMVANQMQNKELVADALTCQRNKKKAKA